MKQAHTQPEPEQPNAEIAEDFIQAPELSRMKRLGLKARLVIGFLLLLFGAAVVSFTALLQPVGLDALLIALLVTALASAGPIFFWIVAPFNTTLDILETGVRSLEDGDFSFRLAPPPQPEMYRLICLFNRLADRFRGERGLIYQKELLLDTVIQSAPMAILLVGPTQYIILANLAAREMFLLTESLVGMKLSDLLALGPDPFKSAFEEGQDVLFSLSGESEAETYHLSRRFFQLNGMQHQLVMVKHLTREIRREEVRTWKKLIRLINHELNNSLAPLSSLIHSARTILPHPHLHSRLEPIFDTMTSTTAHLTRFVQDYATFARLPHPRKELVPWQSFLTQIGQLYPFRLDMENVPPNGYFDPNQMQQVFINLLKNAAEASPSGALPFVRFRQGYQGCTFFDLMDEGKGMSPQAMEKALLPFYSTKTKGTGLGLPLCREILESHEGGIRLQAAASGGLQVTCWIPGPPSAYAAD